MDRDTFVFQFDWLVEFANELPINKRTVLKVVAKLYDPLGLISPLCIPIETLFQDLCKLKIGWDDPLDEELSLRYSQWLSDLSKCIPTQRCYLQDESVISLQLHGFRDGSEVAYAAAVYLRVETSQGVYVHLLMSKSQVVALSKQTIPWIELLASLIPSRLISRVRSALLPLVMINEVFFWTDSTTTLHWIKGVDKEYKQFVRTESRKSVRMCRSERGRNHCSGRQNPADLPSHGIWLDTLKQSQLWWHGPFRLEKEKKIWPYFGNSHEPSSAYFEEMRLKDKGKPTTELLIDSSMTSLTSIFEPQK